MHRPIDVLFGGLLLAGLVGSLSTAGRTALLSPEKPAGLPPGLLLATASAPADPSPETYKRLAKMGKIIVGQHVVRPRESLGSVAKLYGSTSTSIRSTNRLESPYLSPGRTLTVHSGTGMLHQVREEKGATESLKRVAERYSQSVERIARANRLPGVALLRSNWLQPGDALFIPDGRLRFTDYDMPVAWVPGKRLVSSGFGMRRHPVFRYRSFHKGWDMPRPYGTSVKSARDGRVVFADWRTGYGRLVIVKHDDGVRTWYGHLSSMSVSSGQRVKRGQTVGRVGTSGISTGPHLHFEVRDRFGNSLNPKRFLF
jgi:murein DD-endopeptidase MepM/ murein hydrolase activator NlpD